jgi:Flp pilus assembly protein TadG
MKTKPLSKDRRRRGQGLVEFALILPVLLLILIGTIEFARIFFIYISITNAAREGARYGMVNPKDLNGILNEVGEKMELVDPTTVAVSVEYDSGPGTAKVANYTNASGGRVIVTMHYIVRPLTPIMDPFMPDGMKIRTENRRTIQSDRNTVSTLAAPAPPTVAPATATPEGTLAAATSTPLATETLPAIATSTDVPPTEEASPTPSPTPLPPVIIDDPVLAAETSVAGTAAAGRAVTLRVVQTGLQRTVTVADDGTFVFDGLPELVEGHTILVQGYGSQDLAVVKNNGTPTATPTSTPTVTPTPDRSGTHVKLAASECITPGLQDIDVAGGLWPTNAGIKKVKIYWNGKLMETMNFNQNMSDWTETLKDVDVTYPGPHKLSAEGVDNQGNVKQEMVDVSVPLCYVLPDLVVQNIEVTDAEPLGTYERLHITADIYNAAWTDVTSLFWVDLYADPDPDTPLENQASVDYVAVNVLGGTSSITFTMYVPDGFATTGFHTLVAVADTWDQIQESDEDNNVSAPITVTISEENPTPTPTPEVTVGPSSTVFGQVFLDGIAQNYVNVYVYGSDGRLWASGRTNDDGIYNLSGLAIGQYSVVAELRRSDGTFMDVQPLDVTEAGVLYQLNLFLSGL